MNRLCVSLLAYLAQILANKSPYLDIVTNSVCYHNTLGLMQYSSTKLPLHLWAKYLVERS